MAPAWVVAARRMRGALSSKEIPAVALGGAFTFVVMLFNVPVPGGTTAHAVGAALAGIVLGPGPALLAVTAALAIQALVFFDGGVLTLGANCFNMALVMPISGYAVYQTIAGRSPGATRRATAAALAGYAGVNLGALAAAVELGLTPALEPGHCPYGLGTTIPAVMGAHLIVVGFIEAAVTAGVVARVTSSGGLAGARTSLAGERLPTATRRLWAALGALCLLSPLGLLAAGTAFGEWAPAELKERLGYTPDGVASLSRLWHGVLPEYSIPGLGPRTGYAVSALLGAALIGAAVYAGGRALIRSRRAESVEK